MFVSGIYVANREFFLYWLKFTIIISYNADVAIYSNLDGRPWMINTRNPSKYLIFFIVSRSDYRRYIFKKTSREKRTIFFRTMYELVARALWEKCNDVMNRSPRKKKNCMTTIMRTCTMVVVADTIKMNHARTCSSLCHTHTHTVLSRGLRSEIGAQRERRPSETYIRKTTAAVATFQYYYISYNI